MACDVYDRMPIVAAPPILPPLAIEIRTHAGGRAPHLNLPVVWPGREILAAGALIIIFARNTWFGFHHLPQLRWFSDSELPMGRDRESASTFFTGLASGFGGKPTSPLSKSLSSPAPQTGLSTTSRVTSNRTLICDILFSQFSNSRTSSSFPFSPTSPQNRSSPVTMDGSTPSILWRPILTTASGCSSYDG